MQLKQSNAGQNKLVKRINRILTGFNRLTEFVKRAKRGGKF